MWLLETSTDSRRKKNLKETTSKGAKAIVWSINLNVIMLAAAIFNRDDTVIISYTFFVFKQKFKKGPLSTKEEDYRCAMKTLASNEFCFKDHCTTVCLLLFIQ